jgi:hypothetical protein
MVGGAPSDVPSDPGEARAIRRGSMVLGGASGALVIPTRAAPR